MNCISERLSICRNTAILLNKRITLHKPNGSVMCKASQRDIRTYARLSATNKSSEEPGATSASRNFHCCVNSGLASSRLALTRCFCTIQAATDSFPNIYCIPKPGTLLSSSFREKCSKLYCTDEKVEVVNPIAFFGDVKRPISRLRDSVIADDLNIRNLVIFMRERNLAHGGAS
jgi:hypothetical protein